MPETKTLTKKDIVHPAARPYVDDIGKTVYSREKTKTGIVSNVSARNCAACGFSPCYVVKWDDGRITKPCVRGVEALPDGTLHIM